MFNKFAYYTEDKNRYDLNITLSNKPNKQGLYLEADFDKNILHIKTEAEYITQYSINHLISRLEEKHPATFWVEAETEILDNKEYFPYYKIEYTKKPNSEALPYLLSEGIVTLDFVMHTTESGTIRDHGFPFN